MKKIPTLFKKIDLENHKQVVSKEVNPGMELVLNGEGIATVKIDGSATAIINGVFIKDMMQKMVRNHLKEQYHAKKSQIQLRLIGHTG